MSPADWLRANPGLTVAQAAQGLSQAMPHLLESGDWTAVRLRNAVREWRKKHAAECALNPAQRAHADFLAVQRAEAGGQAKLPPAQREDKRGVRRGKYGPMLSKVRPHASCVAAGKAGAAARWAAVRAVGVDGEGI